MSNSTVLPIDSNFLLLETYSVSDENLISNETITSTFNTEEDYIEYFVYGLNNSLLYPLLEDGTIPYSNYSILNGNLSIDPSSDLELYGFNQGAYNTLYNFFSNRLNSSFTTQYFISEISSDRTEIRLDSNEISDPNIISSVTSFISERETDDYFPDFLLNFGSNQTIIANNIALDGATVLIKLYESLPPQFQIKSTLWVVEEVAESISYNISFDEEILEELDTTISLGGPNINLSIKDQVNNSTQATSLEELDISSLTGSAQQLKSLFNEKGIQINVDYNYYSNFINFSSIEERIKNFEYKLQQIETYQLAASSGSALSNSSITTSRVYYENLIDDTITNFDGYEYFLYFESGSKSWPKANSTPPYQNLPTSDSNSITWYNEQITSASLYDELNQDNLFYDIPEYLRTDPQNQQYIDFVEMIGQNFDNVWIYLKDISNKYNADNRINAGVSKDLVAQILRDFSLKIYQNNFSSTDVYSAFLGLTPSGSLFPFPNMTGSLPTPSGFEYVDTFISSSTDAVPLDDITKRIYKRLYHNLPYLLKSKGTVQGVKSLITTFGIPDTILDVSEFGGKDKDNSNDYDYWQKEYNYAFDTGVDGFISSSWVTNSGWGGTDVIQAVQFRFKTPGLESAVTTMSQSLWNTDNNVHLTLEYTGSGYTSGSYSGSKADPDNQYATLKFYPDYAANPTDFTSVYLPFYDGGWWSVMASLTSDGTASLSSGNSIYNGQTGTQLGFYGTGSILNVDYSEWATSIFSYFANTSIYPKFSGSLQEIRYYNVAPRDTNFQDYIMNPSSIEGNSLSSGSLDLSPDQLLFRASLGGELYTSSISIHPKVAGSWVTTSSFTSDSNFHIENGSFVSNVETVFLDQPAVGIKNRINDKIRPVGTFLPTYTYTEGAIIPDASSLSNQKSIQQDKIRNDVYTNNINSLEVTFSPQNQINDDMISQLGYFNIGDLIGDPRDISSSAVTYPELDTLRKEYFLKYVHENYDFNDYIRLIKFFDNSLFKMIKDYTPAKTSLASGVTIKPTILERYKYPLPQVQWEYEQLSGSIKSFPLDYETGSLVLVSGGDGGSFPTPTTAQSWSGVNSTPVGLVPFTHSDASEFFTGELSGSTIIVEDGELNPLNPVKYEDITTVNYQVTGSNVGSNATTGRIIWTVGSRDINPGGFTLLEFYCSTMFINEVSDNNIEMQSALANLSPGDKITFTIYYYENRFGTFVPKSKTITQSLQNISANSPTIWRLQFDNTTATPLFDDSNGYSFAYNTGSSEVILDPYLNTPNFENSVWNAVIGNATNIRPGTLYQDIDYSTSTTTPVNFQSILSGSATRATVPDSNYSTERITIPRYKGSRSTSNGFNLNSTSGGLGVLPNVEQDRSYFAYFNWVGGTAPEWGNGLVDRSGLSIRYFIDSDGNVLEPTNDSKGINLSIVRQTFTEGETSVLSFNDQSGVSAAFSNLIGDQTVFKSGKTITPIIYTQTQSISDTTPGGATGSLNFYQGDGDTALYDYRLTNKVKIPLLTISQSGQLIPYDRNISSGNEGSIDTTIGGWAYRATSPPVVDGVTLNFTATVRNAGLGAVPNTFDLQFYKSTNNSSTFLPVGTPVLCDFSVSSNVEYSITYSDSTTTISDRYQLRADNYVKGGTNNCQIDEESFFRVGQNPLPDLGPVSNFFNTPNNSTTLQLHPDFNDYYGLTQQNLKNSGFFNITNPFTLQPGDEIRFNGTEDQVWTILEVHEDTNPISFTLNKFISQHQSVDWFLVRRYIDAPGSILIEADKPAGGTSPGFFIPLYATKGIEDNFDRIIQKLKTDQLL